MRLSPSCSPSWNDSEFLSKADGLRPLACWCRSATGNRHASILLACHSLIRRLMAGRFAPAVICSGFYFAPRILGGKNGWF